MDKSVASLPRTEPAVGPAAPSVGDGAPTSEPPETQAEPAAETTPSPDSALDPDSPGEATDGPRPTEELAPLAAAPQAGTDTETPTEVAKPAASNQTKKGAAPTSYSDLRGFGGANPFDGGAEQHLDLPIFLDALVEDGYISKRQAEDVLIAPRTQRELNMHPLEIVAAREYDNRRHDNHKLDLETLTLWLAERSNQPYVRIDPLGINVNAATEVMSYAFAQRHNILADRGGGRLRRHRERPAVHVPVGVDAHADVARASHPSRDLQPGRPVSLPARVLHHRAFCGEGRRSPAWKSPASPTSSRCSSWWQ